MRRFSYKVTSKPLQHYIIHTDGKAIFKNLET